MATAITDDFVTKNGIVVQGTSAVTSSTGQSNALQVDGGGAFAKNLIVGTTATIGDNLRVTGYAYIDGAFTATGAAVIGDTLIVSSLAASTATVSENALYVAGGVGIDKTLVVTGEAIFKSNVVFSGTTTYVLTTNTVYTDNIIELHYPNNTSGAWVVDDGNSIGIRFHYYDTQDKNGFLGRSPSGYLEWLTDAGTDGIPNPDTGTYGTFKLGSIILDDVTASTSTNTGALIVAGGIGLDGAIYSGSNISGDTITARNLTENRVVLVGANGQLIDNTGLTYDTSTNVLSAISGYATTATNLDGGAVGSIPYQTSTGTTTFIPIGTSGFLLASNGSGPEWISTGTVVSGLATTASNISGGAAMEIPYQTGDGSTAFEYNFRYDYQADTLRTVNAIFTGTTNSQSTDTGALQVVGGVGIGGGLVVGGTTTATNAYISNNLTASAITGTNIEAGGIGWGSVYLTQFASVFAEGGASTTNVLMQASGNNLAAGIGIATLASGQSLYSSGGINFTTNRTLRDRDTPQGGNTFMSLSTAGVLTLSGNVAATSNTTGALTVAGGVGISGDVYVGGTIFGTVSGSITTSSNLTSGVAGQIPIQLAPGVTAFISTGSVGDLLQQQTGNTATFVSTSTIQVGYSVTATNIAAGSTGQLLYQSTAGITSFVSTAIAGNVLVSNGAAAPSYNNTLNLSGTTSATSVASGALVVAGGVGIGGNLYVAGEIVAQKLTIELTTVTTTFVKTDDIISTYNATASTGTTTGALTVVGGVGVGGNIYAGNDMYSKGNLVVTTATINQFASQITINAGTDTAVNTSTGNIVIWNTSTLQTITDRGYTTTNQIRINNTLSSTSSFSSNALYVAGGIGGNSGFNINGDGYLNGNLTINGYITGTNVSLNLLSANSGTFYGDVTGAGALYAGVVGYTAFPQTMFQATGNYNGYMQINVQNINSGSKASTDIVAASDNVTVSNGFIDMGIASSNWDGSQLFTFGNAIGPNDGYLMVGANSTPGYGDLVMGTLGSSTNVRIVVAGTNSNYTTAWFNAANTQASSTNTGALIVYGGIGLSGNIYAGGVITATNFYGNLTGAATKIAGGSTGSIVIQSDSGTTAFIPLGTAGYVLTASTTTATWSALSGLASGRSTTATNLDLGTAGQIPYQTAPGVTAFFGPGTTGTVLVSNGTSSPAYQNTLTLAGTNTSVSTTTGALQVIGGVGIGGSVYVGNKVGFVNTGNVSTVYQYYNAATNSLDTVFG